jgi:hypothetical protein
MGIAQPLDGLLRQATTKDRLIRRLCPSIGRHAADGRFRNSAGCLGRRLGAGRNAHRRARCDAGNGGAGVARRGCVGRDQVRGSGGRLRQPRGALLRAVGRPRGQYQASQPRDRQRPAGQLHVGRRGARRCRGRDHHLQLRSEAGHRRDDRDRERDQDSAPGCAGRRRADHPERRR